MMYKKILKAAQQVPASVWCFFLVLGFGIQSFGLESRQYAVELSASVQVSPPRITLSWTGESSTTSYTVYRKSGSSWSQIASLGASATTFADTSVALGTA